MKTDGPELRAANKHQGHIDDRGGTAQKQLERFDSVYGTHEPETKQHAAAETKARNQTEGRDRAPLRGGGGRGPGPRRQRR